MRRTLLAAPTLTVAVFAAWVVLSGCEMPTPDANPQAFRTAEEVATARRSAMRQRWKQQAAAIVREDRPGIDAASADGFAIRLEAAGVAETVDLSPLFDLLMAQPEASDAVLREHLNRRLPAFDQRRLAATPLDRIRVNIRPMLLSTDELNQLSAVLGDDVALHSTLLVEGLRWAPVMPWSRGAFSVIGPDALAAWNVQPDEIDRIAMENVRRDVRALPTPFTTTTFGPLGRAGRLVDGVDPAVMLTPEFLAAVRQAWNTKDDLAILLASRRSAQFIESGNTKLLNMLYPAWERLVADTPQPLARRPLKWSDGGVALLKYDPPVRLTPTTGPATRRYFGPPKKPVSRPYIVR